MQLQGSCSDQFWCVKLKDPPRLLKYISHLQDCIFFEDPQVIVHIVLTEGYSQPRAPLDSRSRNIKQPTSHLVISFSSSGICLRWCGRVADERCIPSSIQHAGKGAGVLSEYPTT